MKNVNFKKQFHKLYKYYDKELKTCYKMSLRFELNGLDYFSIYLRYMRDYYLLTAPVSEDVSKNIPFVALCSAIAEYDNYLSCINKYYKVNKANVVEQINKELSKEEILKTFQKEKQTHWSNFWEIVKTNIESWEVLNDLTV